MRAPKHVISLEKNHRELATTEYGNLIVHNNIQCGVFLSF